MQDLLLTSVKYIQGIGPKRAELLEKELGIYTCRDLLFFAPFRYIDKSKIYSINELESSLTYIQLRGKVISKSIVGETPKNKRLVIVLKDSTGSIELIFFKGIKWVSEKIKIGEEYIAFGKPSEFNGIFNMVHPELTSVAEETNYGGSSNSGVYSSTEKLKNSGITNKVLSKCIANALEKYYPYIKETLPENILKDKFLLPLNEAIRNIHFPINPQLLQRAQYRLKFEELFYLQLSLLKQKAVRTKADNGILFNNIGNAFNSCYNSLPFPLTNAQKRVIKEIRQDTKSGRQMNRLLQGDVGSGKTMVAVFSVLMAIDNGYQACIMAPTEVLAQQHFKGISKMLQTAGVTSALLSGSTKAKDRREILQGIADGSLQVLIGTHALLEDNVIFKNLGIAIIDEQHRFGVEQRSRLWKKNTVPPHILVMTATPIPRTLAMTLYGDLDVSVIDELPPGRKPVKTIHVSENGRSKVYNFMKSEIHKGRQIFIVYPLIKESEKMDYKNLQEGYEKIIEEFKAPEYITAVVHGQQKNEDKQYDMNLFASGKAHILVATSVIEVGVDVPNASVMIIESAERFGLSQLHQLRGRVGRGSDEAYCILMTGYKLSKESRQRIELMCQTSDGFELAEADLRMRGPGDLEGTAQSGIAFDLRVANLSKDSAILETARETANQILQADPHLENASNALLRKTLENIKKEGKDITDFSVVS